MNVILDYDSGNLDSVLRGFEKAGIPSVVSKDIALIDEATSLILPGVGAFGDAMQALKASGLIPSIIKHVDQGKPLFGICLGMQLLYEKSFEHGEHEGLGLLKGQIMPLDVTLKVPHMGWNTLSFKRPDDPIVQSIEEQSYVYFVHSYYVVSDLSEVVAYTNYERLIPAIVHQGNIYATQFHPEKSGEVGHRILKAYKKVIT